MGGEREGEEVRKRSGGGMGREGEEVRKRRGEEKKQAEKGTRVERREVEEEGYSTSVSTLTTVVSGCGRSPVC